MTLIAVLIAAAFMSYRIAQLLDEFSRRGGGDGTS